MPELPEVEVIKRSLKRNIIKTTIKKVKINNINLRYALKKRDFTCLENIKIKSIERRSKYILINFQNGFSLIIHLGMTGKFFLKDRFMRFHRTSFYYPDRNSNNKHDHIIFELDNKSKLIYNDVRRFGFIKVIKTKKINENQHLKFLGPEPLSSEFNIKYFKEKVKNTIRNIKDILMDQKFVAGLGNIYVNEILFQSKVRPKRKAKSLNIKSIERIIKNTQEILNQSIKFGGSSIRDFSDGEGKKGAYQQKFMVYGRSKEQCLNRDCRSTIQKEIISQRSTFYCKSCQK